MKQFAIYGKGGSGKSTVASALSVLMAREGLRVLQVGCDPKADSTLGLTRGRRVKTLLDLLAQGNPRPVPSDFVVNARPGIDCAEAGGPVPGAGCGGRGIARMFEHFADLKWLEQAPYDVTIYDVLGDVVCGGFAAPLRVGFATRAFVVVSEEPLSLFAANNVIHAVDTYRRNGVHLAGLIVNVSDDPRFVGRVEAYAKAVGTSIVGVIPRDPAIHEAELRNLTAADVEDSGATIDAFAQLAQNVLAAFDVEPARCLPMSPEQFASFRVSLSGGQPDKTAVDQPIVTAQEPDRGAFFTSTGQAAAPSAGTGTLLGGQQAGRALATLLALHSGKRKQHKLEVARFALDDGRFYFLLVSPTLGTLPVVLHRAGEASDCYATAGNWDVSHKGKLEASARALLDWVVRRLERQNPTWRDMCGLVLNDPQMQVVSESVADARVGRSHGMRLWREWGDACAPGRLFFDEERSRMVMGHLRLGGARTFNIHHSTDVCQFSEQRVTRYSTHMVRFPWLKERKEHSVEERSDWVSTRLGEHHLIAGSDDRLGEVLDSIAQIDQTFDVVSVFVSCTPAVAGEDWRRTIDKFAEGFEGPVLVAGIGETDVVEEIINIVADRIPESNGKPGPEPGVHLVGFPPGRGMRELKELLEMAGVPVHQVQAPVVNFGGLKALNRAAGQLFWPIKEYQRLYDGVFKRIGPCFEIACPPFGQAGTLEFVRQAARMAGCDVSAALEAVRPQVEQTQQLLNGLVAEASSHRLGIAITAEQADLPDRPELLCGVPLVAFLESLGFSVEVLLDCDKGRRLDWWLASGLSAVCSDLSRDRRLLEHGVGQFSLADLEPGLEGAVRTVRRLLGIAKAGFWKGYADTLKGGDDL